jgi:molybdenum cofactor cytidylyltransferase
MGRPKQLLPLDGRRTTIEVVSARVRPHVDVLVVVVGHVAGQVAAVLADHDVELTVNEHVDRGMLSSVQCGLRVCGPEWRGYLVCLGDQPSLSDVVVDTVLAAAAASGRGIVIPTFSGRRGHPVYLSGKYYGEIMGLGSDQGLNVVTRSHEDDTLEVPVPESAILDDMDTPADYARERIRIDLS